MPALDRALALAEREHAAVPVAEHLDLDVARRHDRLLEVDAAVAERRVRLGRGASRRPPRAPRARHEPHALPTAAGRRLQQHRVADPVGDRCARRLVRPTRGAAHHRHAGRAPSRLRLHLVAHALHHVRIGPMKTRSLSAHARDERGVLGEEAVAGVDGLAAGRLGGRDDARDREVALRCRRRADADRAVREAHVERVAVGGRVDGDGLDAELVEVRITRTAISPRLATRTRSNIGGA